MKSPDVNARAFFVTIVCIYGIPYDTSNLYKESRHSRLPA